ncbi:LPS export ABC transporter ATP-binding protein [bacterium Unc6]|nr:LPS export ABC transporter ATP-binding protein [bacterium Unc6]
MSLLEIKNLIKQYSGRKVVNGVSISVDRGEIVGLLGPNGAGKTTIFYITVGSVKGDSGSVIFNKEDITSFSVSHRARIGLGYLSQEPSIFQRLTVEENIMAILETLNISLKERKKKMGILLEQLKISHLAKNKAYTLSGGERRRLEITRALCLQPLCLLLDEPFSGVDPIAVFDVQQIIKQLKNKGLGILLTDHSVRETLTITDRAYIINRGEILVSGTAEALINDTKARQIYLGEQFRM